MASKIEELIEEIEEYIDSCKPSAFSSSKIVVNRDELDSFLEELKSTTPEEIKRYQRIINNKEAILNDARNKADAIIAEAQIQTNELVSEHQIMQQAYAQANEIVMIATKNAQEMIDKATIDANNIREGAMVYTDNLLKSLEEVIASSMETTRKRTDTYLNTMQGYLNVVLANREELSPPKESKKEKPAEPAKAEEKKEEPESKSGPGKISDEFFNKE